MQCSVSDPQPTVEQLVYRIFSSRKITRADQQILMSLLLSKEVLTLEEHQYIDQVFERLRNGLIRVVD